MALRRLSLRSVVPLILAGDVGQLPPCVMTADEKMLERSSMKRFDLSQKVSILEPSMRTGWPCWDMRRQNRIVNGGFDLALSVFYYELKVNFEYSRLFKFLITQSPRLWAFNRFEGILLMGRFKLLYSIFGTWTDVLLISYWAGIEMGTMR